VSSPSPRPGALPLLAGLSLPLYLVDQATKWAVLKFIQPDASIPVIPGFFSLVQIHNTGAAFGMLRNQNTFFLALSLGALAFILWLLLRGPAGDRFTRIACALLIAGICGNLTDRILHGHVIDFLDFILPIYGRWPAFNVADSCICIAAGIFMIRALFDRGGKPGAPTRVSP